MKIGCVKEIKNNEFRVGLTPDNVKAYVAAGHHVYMEKGAGVGSGFSDNEYVDAGASLIDNAADVWHLVDMMVKVKVTEQRTEMSGHRNAETDEERFTV